MIITTLNKIENFKIEEFLGIIFTSKIVSAGAVADITAKIVDVIGGKAKGYTDALNDATLKALSELSSIAEKEGANAIIGVNIRISTVSTNSGAFFIVFCYGNAVRGNYVIWSLD